MRPIHTSIANFSLYMTALFIHSSLSSSSKEDHSACVLDFDRFPYQLAGGECNGVQEKITDWNNFPKTLCCRNALSALSQTLALQAIRDKGKIFIEEGKWRNCHSFFQQPQHSIPIKACGLEDLYYGAGQCSLLNSSSFSGDQNYKAAVSKCSQFNSSSSFDDGCRNCTMSVLGTRDYVLDKLNAKENGTERAICGVAVVISVATQTRNYSSLIDNFYRCLPALDNLYPPATGYVKLNYSLVKALLAIIIAATGVGLLLLLVKHVMKKNNTACSQQQQDHQKPPRAREIATCSSLYRFSKTEIDNAINFAAQKEFLGRGSAGQVYKGVLPSGQVVAIKQISHSNTCESFNRELEGLSRIRHPNLVCLFGCCIEDGEQYLVYEFCAAGNLAQHLLRKDTILPWHKRVGILRDCALGLRYLHHYIDGCIVHRDIKLTNILLTEKLEPKLSDFGLARMLGMEETKVFTDVRGTLGYMDPEYMSNAKLTCASDIYSFGIVTLQLLSGQKVFELDLDARDQLTRKAKDVSMGKRPLKDFEDPRLHGSLNTMDFESILQIAVLCVARSSKGRPTIDVVFEEMDKAWKNTLVEMRAKREPSSSSAIQHSISLEMVSV